MEDFKPLLPRIMIYTDDNNQIKHHCTATVEYDDAEEYFLMLSDYIEAYGKPKTVLVRDERIYSTVCDACEKLGIELNLRGVLEEIDDFVEKIYKDKSIANITRV